MTRSRKPRPKTGGELRTTLRRIAGSFDAADVDAAAVERYRSQKVSHVEVGRLSRSARPRDRQTARLRSVAMLTALDQGADEADDSDEDEGGT